MDTSLIRLIAQVAMTGWSMALIISLFASRGRLNSFRGLWLAVAGLTAFATWMFLLSISIYDSALIPRRTLVPYFAILESGTAICAWLWLAVTMRHTFRFKFRINHNHRNGNGNGAQTYG